MTSFGFTKSNLPKDSETLRRLAVLFGSTMDRDFRTYTLDRVLKVDAKQIDNLLYPLLKADDRPTPAEMLAATRPLIESVSITTATPHILPRWGRASTCRNCCSQNNQKSWKGFADIRRSSGRQTMSPAIS
jgi:hypothetical protein